jgi:two-component system, LytTR family, sensor kinase
MLYETALLPFKLALTYTVIFFIAPKFLFTSRYLNFFLTLALVCFSYGILHHIYVDLFVQPAFEISTPEVLWNWDRITKRMTFLNTPMLLALTLTVLHYYYEQKNLNTRIINEKLTSELKLLKNQLQPHFFFNTLNNLYSLSLQKSDLAPQMILKLSELMRYSLDQSDNDKVLVGEELQFLKNYVAIEQIRFRDKVEVAWNISPEACHVSIPSLILPTFVENAFKHGVANARETIHIDISIYLCDNRLHYRVINTIPKIKEELISNRNNSLGLVNLKKRLELIYKEDFQLNFSKGKNFVAELSVPSDIVKSNQGCES